MEQISQTGIAICKLFSNIKMIMFYTIYFHMSRMIMRMSTIVLEVSPRKLVVLYLLTCNRICNSSSRILWPTI
jgi:hypothetical protein